jgi:hypothetical protein
MGRIAEVIGSKRASDDAGEGLDVQVDPGGSAPKTVEHFAPVGDDSCPLRGDFVALEDSDGSGAEFAAGYADTKNKGQAQPGEKRMYARDPQGTLVCEIWLKGDKTIVIKNENGSIRMAPDGPVTINGLTIDKDGNLHGPGTIAADDEITAKAASPATSVTLSQHIHIDGMGGTQPPTAGT